MFPISTSPQVSSDGFNGNHYRKMKIMSGECPLDQQPVISSRAGQRREVPLTRSRSVTIVLDAQIKTLVKMKMAEGTNQFPGWFRIPPQISHQPSLYWQRFSRNYWSMKIFHVDKSHFEKLFILTKVKNEWLIQMKVNKTKKDNEIFYQHSFSRNPNRW